MKQEKNKIRVAVGLSGGVDSAVSAYLLKKQGYEVTGVYLVCWDEGPHCRAREDRKDALKVALNLDISFEVLDFQKEYKDKVIDRFYADYEKGLTPNPDVWCNSEIKFGMFLKWAMENGYDYVATGHYALLKEGRLLVPMDEHKDQTYFLNQLNKDELKRVMFPLGEMKKTEVREIAKRIKLPVADKKDSVGICFIGDIDVQKFLRRRLLEKEGEVVDVGGKVIGKHKGVWFFTIGQRGGWEIDPGYQKKFGGEAPIMYVVNKDAKNNRLVVGFGAETYRDKFVVEQMNWINDEVEGEIKVRIRHTGGLINCELVKKGKRWEVELDEALRGVAPGQAAVFYKDRECLGGGVIC